jgi:N utilization substance protein A
MTEAEESELRVEELKSRSQHLIDALDVDDVLAHLLVTEGFTSVEEVAFVPIEDLVGIEGLDDEVAEELRERAAAFIAHRDEELTRKRNELGVTDDLAAVPGLTAAILVTLGENEIKTRDDLADLAADELLEFMPDGSLTAAAANDIIMAARAHWFEDEASGDGEGAGNDEGEDGGAASNETAS